MCTRTYWLSKSETVFGTCVLHSSLYASTALTYSVSRSIFSVGSPPVRSRSHSFSSMMSSSLFLSSSNFSVLASAASARSLLFEEVALGLEAGVLLVRSLVALGLIRDGGRAVVLLLRRLGRLDVVEDLALVVLGLVVRLV